MMAPPHAAPHTHSLRRRHFQSPPTSVRQKTNQDTSPLRGIRGRLAVARPAVVSASPQPRRSNRLAATREAIRDDGAFYQNIKYSLGRGNGGNGSLSAAAVPLGAPGSGRISKESIRVRIRDGSPLERKKRGDAGHVGDCPSFFGRPGPHQTTGNLEDNSDKQSEDAMHYEREKGKDIADGGVRCGSRTSPRCSCRSMREMRIRRESDANAFTKPYGKGGSVEQLRGMKLRAS